MKLSPNQVLLKILSEIYQSKHFSSRHTIVFFSIVKCPATINNDSLNTILHLGKNSSYTIITSITIQYELSIINVRVSQNRIKMSSFLLDFGKHFHILVSISKSHFLSLDCTEVKQLWHNPLQTF